MGLTPDEANARPMDGPFGSMISENRSRLIRLRQQFSHRYKVHSYSSSPRNIYEVFRSGDCLLPGRRSHWEDTFRTWIYSSPLFDHLEVWGWAGLPKIIVGHPYPDMVTGADHWLLDEMQRYRLEVQIRGPEWSHYGNGSVQYLAFAFGFLNMVGWRDPNVSPDDPGGIDVVKVPPPPEPALSDVAQYLSRLPGIREGLTTQQIVELVEVDPRDHVELREAIMAWGYRSSWPSMKSIGRRLRGVEFVDKGDFRLTSRVNGARTRVWRIEDAPADSGEPLLR